MLEFQINSISFYDDNQELVKQYLNQIVEVDISSYCPGIPDIDEWEQLLIDDIEYQTKASVSDIDFELV